MKKAQTTLPIFLTLMALTLFLAFPELAFATSQFGAGATTFKSDLIAILTPIIGIGIIVLGVLCGFGKINWMWFAGAIIGIVLIFGHEQIISWVRSSFGV